MDGRDSDPAPQQGRHRRQALLYGLGTFAIIAAVILLVLSPQDPGQRQVPLPPAGAAPAEVPSDARARFFAPDSVWNAPLAADAPLDARSATITEALVALARDRGSRVATTSYSTPIYEVPRDQPTVPVKLDGPDVAYRRSLAAALAGGVPIPSDARQAAGTDGQLTIWQPSTDRLWDFWRARKQADVWHAAWGGAIRKVSSDPGYFSPRAWPGAQRNWGSTATSFAVVAGTIRIDELGRGTIPHALAMAIPRDSVAKVFSLPAERSDGVLTRSDAIPEGARFRLDPKLDLSRLSLPRTTRVIAEAAQRYGIIVRDRTAYSPQLFAEDPTPTGSDPYQGPDGFFEGLRPGQVLATFPWEHLQLMKLDLRLHQLK
jgi:hypothetical protein